MHTLPFDCLQRSRNAQGLCARELCGIGTHDGHALVTGDIPHGAEHAAVGAGLDDGSKGRVVVVRIRGSMVVGVGVRWQRGVLRGNALVLVVLQNGNLSAAKDGFEREAKEEFGHGGGKGAHGVGGGCENGVNSEHGAQKEGGGGGDEGGDAGIEESGRKQGRSDGEGGQSGETGVDGARLGGNGTEDEACAD